MARPLPEAELQAIEAIVRDHPEGLGLAEIAARLDRPIPRRTLQYWLKHLVEENRLLRAGERRWARYRAPADGVQAPALRESGQDYTAEEEVQISPEGAEVQAYVRRPVIGREPVGYDPGFLESYRPNVSTYLSAAEQAELRALGAPAAEGQAAGTYAKRILDRLLIDLSWNSSRLEGNTYSLLDTKRLINFGAEAEGKAKLEAQMILNHKDAIEFLVASAGEIAFDRHTLLNLHGLLANNLLPEPDSVGRLRQIAVGIERSVFLPLEVPQRIEEYFDRLLARAAAIADPFEQAFFVLVQLPYLQPFDDVNKRVSRLAANIPLIKGNLVPLSFTDVPTQLYIEAILGVYELNRVELLKDLFLWAYRRSAARYAAVRQTLGEPDPFRLQYREELRQVVGNVVREALDRQAALARIAARAEADIAPADRERFREVAESELLALHEGNFARYRIRPSEFAAWREVWFEKA